MKKQDISVNQVKIVYLAVGSNLGNKLLNVNKVKDKLMDYKINIIKSSSSYETLSWPNIKYPKFINIVIKAETFYSAKELIKICLNIEKALGRKRTKKNSPRVCDIDIIDYHQKKVKLNSYKLEIPHPRMHLRNFVLLPLYEINKSWIHPIKKKNIKNLINSLNIQDLTAIKQI